MMSLTVLTLALAILTPVLAHPHPTTQISTRELGNQFGCAVQPTPEFLSTVASFAQLEPTNDNSTSFNIASSSRIAVVPVVIDLYFHVVAKSNALSDGYIPEEQLAEQVAVLNKTYAPSGFAFNLIETDYTINTTWANNQDELAMKTALRKGTYRSLNMYFLYVIEKAIGVCYYPTAPHEVGSEIFIKDGCSILYSTVPGGSADRFNFGMTAVHEIGHWLGLLHTFDGGCVGAGDGIADTPAQDSGSTGCPIGRSSCSGNGADPIHNYMDYSDDACMDNFTPNQQARMLNMYNTYRTT